MDRKNDNGPPVNPWTGLPYSTNYFEILEGRKKLPIYAARAEVLQALKNNQVVMLEGDDAGTADSR